MNIEVIDGLHRAFLLFNDEQLKALKKAVVDEDYPVFCGRDAVNRIYDDDSNC